MLGDTISALTYSEALIRGAATRGPRRGIEGVAKIPHLKFPLDYIIYKSTLPEVRPEYRIGEEVGMGVG